MATDEEEQSAISMQDVIEEEESLEATARAVLGPCDETNCTYPKGYMQRQALYACGTCWELTNKLAGICLACSLVCHDGHDLYELYTKRNFRCDCGNSLFSETSKCHLLPEKSPTNDQNRYNHNFRGLYCMCNRPYPDPDQDDEDEMIQCSVCEDWFHSMHLGHPPPAEYDEMVCDECMKKNSFLRVYDLSHAHQANRASHVHEHGDPHQANDQGQPHLANNQGQPHEANNQGQTHKANDQGQPLKANKQGQPHDNREQGPSLSLSTADEGNKTSSSSCQVGRQTGGACILKERVSDAALKSTGAGFFAEDWRSNLCRCPYCMDLYTASKVTFLLDASDTVAAYEATSTLSPTASTSSTLEGGLTAFSTELNHVQQVEALQNYHDLSTGLRDYLKKFADEGRIVKRKDIEDFFDEMKEKKRRKLAEEEGTFPPQNCHF